MSPFGSRRRRKFMFTQLSPAARTRGFVARLAAASITLLIAASPLAAAPTWSVLPDFTGPVTPTSQIRSMRGLALSGDDAKLYAGFIQGSTSSGVRKIDSLAGTVDATVTIASNRQPKA